MLTIVVVTILNTSVVEGNNFLTNFKGYDLTKMLPQPESLFYMFLCTDQGKCNVCDCRTRKV